MDEILRAQIKRDESCRLTAYQDSRGVWTIGWGHTGREVKPGLVWTQQQADDQLETDIAEANAAVARNFSWTDALDGPRLRVLQNMSFNMGIGRLIGFHRLFTALRSFNYDDAADEMANSLWARQVGDRATRLELQMRTGVDQMDGTDLQQTNTRDGENDANSVSVRQ